MQQPPSVCRPGRDAAKPWSGALPFALVCVIAGAALRLSFPADIEYKLDERWLFEHARGLLDGMPWSWTGIPSSIGSPNPGMSLWVFAGLGWLGGIATPVQLARAVQLAACAALVGLLIFARVGVERGEREQWYWAVALWALHPLAIVFERKIWNPSTLPLLVVAFIATWWFRRNNPAAFLGGLVGALGAQIHLPFGVLAIAIAAWTWWRDRAGARWSAWLAGSVIGSLPAWPWLRELTMGQGPALQWHFPNAAFFLRWIPQSLGFGIEYELGSVHMRDYLSGPAILGHPSYLMAFVLVAMAGVGAIILLRAVRSAMRNGWLDSTLLGGRDAAGLLVGAALWAYGGALTAVTIIGVRSHRHYTIVIIPLMALWTARLVLQGDRTKGLQLARGLLVALCVLQGTAAAGLLAYIHRTQVIHDEYGPTWQSQQPRPTP
jgi:hypothetical protein